MESFLAVLSSINSFVWGPFLLIPLLLLTGLYLTIRLRGLQFRVLGHAFWLAFVKRSEKGNVPGDVSHYQALATALAATVGVGNIAGVATAIGIGGPGALFWMWMTGLLGMATKYSEALLGVKYRVTDAKGEQSGGPMYYLTHGVGGWFGKTLGIAFAIFGVLASFGIGNMVQSNTAAHQLYDTWGISPVVSGLCLALVTAVVIIGGIKSIGRFAAAVVPLMIVLYIACIIVVLVAFADRLPAAITLIFTDAFSGSAAAGGFLGSSIILAVQMGVARGIFSNESGLGTGAIAAAAAKTDKPVRQAMVSMTQTFLDTLVVVTFTALAIIVTGAWMQEGLKGAPMTAWALEQGMGGGWGLYTVAISVMVYAFTTILGWSYYGERCMERLLGRVAVMPYRLIFSVMVFVGAVTSLEVVWTFSDIANGLMALPNLIGLLLLSGIVVKETRDYMSRKDWKDAD
ncbi:sodium:alanine symporter family protein [Pseudomonas seleniipraecipitans]|uniref:Sodium:alanine symporter family protein n=1 Tax=Phytopseudomonas seleniipraecipitans TaxID=640205 RepID=A0ABY5J283_9GAMM|nr:sodium:alanine symporter family protein [Pseudomonas seleniipraecipitans]UUD62182.1 sodium:alanine symporter family protein [Pseudomonas seleniipraecipitans]